MPIRTAFGLAFDIEKGPTNSGFWPAQIDLGAGKELFGDLRLEGFAALLSSDYAETLVLAGGDEGRYKNATPVINRAAAIREMLIGDFNIAPDRVLSFPSRSNTGGNIAIIKSVMTDRGLAGADCALISNHYHIPRALLDLYAAGINMRAYPAESFLLLEDAARKNDLIERLGGGPLAERCAEEIQGIADKIRGTYKPRTDAAAVTFDPLRQK